MSKEVWDSQLEINKIFDKRIDMASEQLTKLTELVIAQGNLIGQLVKATEPTTPTTPTKCGKHCACKAGEM